MFVGLGSVQMMTLALVVEAVLLLLAFSVRPGILVSTCSTPVAHFFFHPSPHLLTHAFTNSLAHSLKHQTLTDSCNNSLTHSRTHARTHSLSLFLKCTPVHTQSLSPPLPAVALGAQPR